MPRTPKAAKCTKNLKIATYQRLKKVKQMFSSNSAFSVRLLPLKEGFLVPPCLLNRISLNEFFLKFKKELWIRCNHFFLVMLWKRWNPFSSKRNVYISTLVFGTTCVIVGISEPEQIKNKFTAPNRKVLPFFSGNVSQGPTMQSMELKCLDHLQHPSSCA